VVAVSGSVVAVPLVGWVPLHPPEAEQDCASFALHCNVVAVPMATLLFVATRVTAGLAVPAMGAVWVVSLDDDWPHAANADNVTHASAQRMRREALT